MYRQTGTQLARTHTLKGPGMPGNPTKALPAASAGLPTALPPICCRFCRLWPPSSARLVVPYQPMMTKARATAAEPSPAGAAVAQAASSIIEDGGPTPSDGSGRRISVHERRVPAR